MLLYRLLLVMMFFFMVGVVLQVSGYDVLCLGVLKYNQNGCSVVLHLRFMENNNLQFTFAFGSK